jgi:delta-1-pyrroline-5-carboxylate synthetase
VREQITRILPSSIITFLSKAVKLQKAGKEVLIVTSGAVGVGRRRLRKQGMLKQSMSDLISLENNQTGAAVSVSYNSACAAAGQLGLMSLYETMFNQYDIATSQLLVTAFDFTSPERRRNIQHVITELLALRVVPIINENDAVSANQGYKLFDNAFSDNDSLAAMVAIEMSAQLLILLTDVDGVYDRPPTEKGAKRIDIFSSETYFQAGEKSLRGRGGMSAKVDAALKAVDGGVQVVAIAAGSDFEAVERIITGQNVGTLFMKHSESSSLSNKRKRIEDLDDLIYKQGMILF